MSGHRAANVSTVFFFNDNLSTLAFPKASLLSFLPRDTLVLVLVLVN